MITRAEIEKEIRENYSENLLESVSINGIISGVVADKIELDIKNILREKEFEEKINKL